MYQVIFWVLVYKMNFCFICVCVCVQSLSYIQLFVTPWTMHARLVCPWGSLSKDTEVGYHFLLQRIIPDQGSNPCLLHWQADSLPLSHRVSPTLCFDSGVFLIFFAQQELLGRPSPQPQLYQEDVFAFLSERARNAQTGHKTYCLSIL